MAACLALLLLVRRRTVSAAGQCCGLRGSIDVNPSIELRVNQNEKVLACVPMNDDAHAILADMGGGKDLKGAKLDVAVNAIVGSLVRNGYLESISSAIMISVEDRDQSRAHRLQQDLSAAVDGILRDSASQASVLTQTVTQDTSLEKQAKDHHISTGKAALVNRILALNNSLSFEELSRLSIGELKDLAETGAPAMPIGMERALEIAPAHLRAVRRPADQAGRWTLSWTRFPPTTRWSWRTAAVRSTSIALMPIPALCSPPMWSRTVTTMWMTTMTMMMTTTMTTMMPSPPAVPSPPGDRPRRSQAAALTHAGVQRAGPTTWMWSWMTRMAAGYTRWNSRRMAWSTNMSSMPIPALYWNTIWSRTIDLITRGRHFRACLLCRYSDSGGARVSLRQRPPCPRPPTGWG